MGEKCNIEYRVFATLESGEVVELDNSKPIEYMESVVKKELDFTKVVKCRNCKHWIRNEEYSYLGRCELWNIDFEDDFYCADGDDVYV